MEGDPRSVHGALKPDGDFDLNKVDKADDKHGRFITMLQVKYGYTRQQARAGVNKFWLEYEANNSNNI